MREDVSTEDFYITEGHFVPMPAHYAVGRLVKNFSSISEPWIFLEFVPWKHEAVEVTNSVRGVSHALLTFKSALGEEPVFVQALLWDEFGHREGRTHACE